MSTYKLYYGNGSGRAEVSRLIFAAASQKFEDVRYELDEWPLRNAEMPLGQVTVLELDGVKLPQSISIARFLAKQFQLAGKDSFEQAKVDTVADTINDLMTAFLPTRAKKDEAKIQELIKKFLTDELPKHFKNLETLAKLYSNGGAFFVGNNLTWVDLLFHDVTETLLQIDQNGLNNNLWLKQNRQEVEKQPKIAEYLQNRPKTAY